MSWKYGHKYAECGINLVYVWTKRAWERLRESERDSDTPIITGWEHGSRNILLWRFPGIAQLPS